MQRCGELPWRRSAVAWEKSVLAYSQINVMMCTQRHHTSLRIAMSNIATAKEERLAIRIAPETKEMLRRAAERQHASLSHFIVGAAIERAASLLADETRFVVSQEMADAFCSALDAPARDIPALTRLFAEKSVLEH
jgi:uncharacterized protein (DUF1778 family)